VVVLLSPVAERFYRLWLLPALSPKEQLEFTVYIILTGGFSGFFLSFSRADAIFAYYQY
jgi:hypothetical protein